MKSLIYFVAGVLVGGVCVLQLKSNADSASARVGEGVKTKLQAAAGPLGGVVGSVYDGLNLGAVANPVLDLFGVPYNA